MCVFTFLIAQKCTLFVDRGGGLRATVLLEGGGIVRVLIVCEAMHSCLVSKIRYWARNALPRCWLAAVLFFVRSSFDDGWCSRFRGDWPLLCVLLEFGASRFAMRKAPIFL